jgi:two-component system phosphate regulon sensor histidine kinase PhoR
MDFDAVAHDLRTPLHVMLAHMQLLADERLSDLGRRRLDIVETQIRRMVRLLDTCTAPVTPPASVTRVDLSAMIRDVMDELRVILERRAIEIALTVDTPLLPVPGDRDALHRVLVNVLVNAADSISGAGRIVVRARRAQLPSMFLPAVQIEITDTGAGIPAELIPRVFEQGFSTKRAGRGLGLGICREIVEIHGGSMELASEQGHGTTVRLSLPTGD